MNLRNGVAERQEVIDRLYWSHGPCCAGCDHWRHLNVLVGECRAGPPVGSAERVAMLGIEGCSLPPSAGHVFTPRDHLCGEFKDEFDWQALPAAYLRRIGMERRDLAGCDGGRP
jgi:hypothetical protein